MAHRRFKYPLYNNSPTVKRGCGRAPSTATDAEKGWNTKRSFCRARFSLLNKHPAGYSFTADLGGDSAPHTLGTAPLALVGSLRSQHGFAMREHLRLKHLETNY